MNRLFRRLGSILPRFPVVATILTIIVVLMLQLLCHSHQSGIGPIRELQGVVTAMEALSTSLSAVDIALIAVTGRFAKPAIIALISVVCFLAGSTMILIVMPNEDLGIALVLMSTLTTLLLHLKRAIVTIAHRWGRVERRLAFSLIAFLAGLFGVSIVLSVVPPIGVPAPSAVRIEQV
jgi:hypothetical protein